MDREQTNPLVEAFAYQQSFREDTSTESTIVIQEPLTNAIHLGSLLDELADLMGGVAGYLDLVVEHESYKEVARRARSKDSAVELDAACEIPKRMVLSMASVLGIARRTVDHLGQLLLEGTDEQLAVFRFEKRAEEPIQGPVAAEAS